MESVTLDNPPRVGGKNASLGEMLGAMKEAGVRVPGGFALTVDTFHLHLSRAELDEAINEELDRLDVADIRTLAKTAESIRRRIVAAELPEEVVEDVRDAYRKLCDLYGGEDVDVAVRSSATAEARISRPHPSPLPFTTLFKLENRERGKNRA